MAMLLGAPRLAGFGLPRGSPRVSVHTGVTRNALLTAAMAFVVVAIAGLAYWDAARESAAALAELADREATLARALAALVAPSAQVDARPLAEADLLARFRVVERPRALAVLIHRPGEDALRATSGALIRSPSVLEALGRAAVSARIPRDEAAAFGLPARTA